MLAISMAAHMALAVAALAVPSLLGTPLRLEPVAVVDLIGGGEFERETTKPPTPAASESRKPAPRARTESTRPPATRGKVAKAAPEDFVPAKRRAADAALLTDRLRKMREARAGSEAVREAVEERRNEAAARAAVRSVGDRVGRRIEAPPSARPGSRGAPVGGGGGGGAQGTVRVSPELRDYFRRLEESVRSSWVLPGSLARDAAKLVVELRIVIEKAGRVSGGRIERGCGRRYYDGSA